MLYIAETDLSRDQERTEGLMLQDNRVPEIYTNFTNIFSETKATVLSSGTAEYIINLEPGKQSLHGSIYLYLRDKLKIL